MKTSLASTLLLALLLLSGNSSIHAKSSCDLSANLGYQVESIQQFGRDFVVHCTPQKCWRQMTDYTFAQTASNLVARSMR